MRRNEKNMKHINLKTEMIHKGTLILVNPAYAITEEPANTLIPACDAVPDILLDRGAAVLLNQLMREIDGWRSIVPVSGYRSLQEQQNIWEDTLRGSGLEFTRKYVAVPGHSEHQTGLAIDLGLKQEHVDFICPDFPYTGICQTFREKAADYGFILRYPAGKETVTGIGHEPWHFRYVGIPHAQIMKKKGLTLEEYIEFIRQYSYGTRSYRLPCGSEEIQVSYLPAAEAADVAISGDYPYTVSGNNIDGFILTEWRMQSRNAETKELQMA